MSIVWFSIVGLGLGLGIFFIFDSLVDNVERTKYN